MTLDVEATYREHAAGVRGYLYARVRDPDIADDLASATWERVVRYAPSYRDEGRSPRAWVVSIAHNVLVDWTRRRKLLAMAPLDDVAFSLGYSQVGTGEHVDALVLSDAIAGLSAVERTTIVGRYYEGRRLDEVGPAKSTAFRRERAALAALARRLRRTA